MDPRRKPLCFIPARGGSKRLARKNIAMLKGKPLLAWSIEAALASDIFDRAFVSSEDDEILRVAGKWGGEPVRRDKDLAGDRVTLLQLCLNEVRKITERHDYSDLYLLLPTSPLRKPGTIRAAWKRFQAGDVDTLMSVVPCEHPPQWAFRIQDERLSPLFPEYYEQPRQELIPAYRHDGGHMIIRISTFLASGSFTAGKTIPFPAPQEEAVDINTPVDLLWAEFLLEKEMDPYA